MDLSPKLGLTLDQYLEVLIRSGLDLGPDLGLAIAQQVGIDAKRWKFGAPKWKEIVDKHSGEKEIADRYRAITEKVHGPPPDMDILEYADICVRLQRGEALASVAKEHGIDAMTFSRVSMAMVEKLNEPRVNALYTAAHRKASAYAGYATRLNRRAPNPEQAQQKEAVAPPKRIRGRKCPSCGAFKVTPHHHVYIYCDFCGALFDYDVRLRDRKEADLAADAFMDLICVIDFEPVPEDIAKRDEHRREQRIWMQRSLVEMFPNDHPPRVREAAYRKAYIESWLVPTQTAWMNDPTTQGTAEIVNKAQQRFLGKKPTFENAKPLYEAMLVHLEAQARIADREGLFAAHPDGLDTERFIRFSRSAFVSSLGKMSDNDADALIDLAGLRCEMIAPPSTALANAGCAGCGSELTLAEGANRTICTDCGVVVEASDRRSCRSCGAILVGGQQTWSACGYCKTRWEAV